MFNFGVAEINELYCRDIELSTSSRHPFLLFKIYNTVKNIEELLKKNQKKDV